MSGLVPVSFFHDDQENEISVLGQNFITSILSQGSVEASVLILTDKRLYQKGVIYERASGSRFTRSTGKKVINLKDITGTSFSANENILDLILGMVSLILTVAIIASEEVRLALCFILYIPPIASVYFFVKYFLSRRRFFVVEYAGGAIATRCNWYSENEIDEFQKRISQVKDLSR